MFCFHNFTIWVFEYMYVYIFDDAALLSHVGYFMDWLLKRTAGNIRLGR